MSNEKWIKREDDMINSLKEGDLVRLKSGSPTMTVDSIHDFVTSDVSYCCMWFNQGLLQSGKFKREALKIVLEPNKP